MLKKNSKPELAKEVEDLIKQYAATPYRLNGVLKSKPFYKELAATYLPKLRKVQYTYGYSIFRSLTDDEIRELYRKNPKQLTNGSRIRESGVSFCIVATASSLAAYVKLS